MLDLFVTHNWRENDDRDRANALIDEILGLNWRNYGNPWYDPSIQFTSPEGIAYLKDRLEGQLQPSQAVILIPSIYQVNQRGKIWVGNAIARSRELAKPVVGLSADGNPPGDGEIAAMADRWVEWDGQRILSAIDEMIRP